MGQLCLTFKNAVVIAVFVVLGTRAWRGRMRGMQKKPLIQTWHQTRDQDPHRHISGQAAAG